MWRCGAPFPFTDQTASKKRPAVVVRSDAYHASQINVVLMGISSQITTPLRPGEVIITDWNQAGLLNPSVMKPVLTTIEKKLVIRKLGKLIKTDRNAARGALNVILG